MKYTCIEICAGGGGMALGLEMAGFGHVALVEYDRNACNTLRFNRPHWNVVQADVHNFSAREHAGVDVLAGGIPCPPFSTAGKQLGEEDERNLFPEMLRLIEECKPKAVLIENVKGLLDPKFNEYRSAIQDAVENLGYTVQWKKLDAQQFGVPQRRPRVMIVALRRPYDLAFEWPHPYGHPAPTVGDVLYEEMASRGWKNAREWQQLANRIAPTIVGGSTKHGGPDLGPTRAKAEWSIMGVDGMGLANEPPNPEFQGKPRLTVSMTARLQGFPENWIFTGNKTPAYRQVGNALPPAMACAVGRSILLALDQTDGCCGA